MVQLAYICTMKVKDLKNKRFGKLLVIEQVLPKEKGYAKWVCKCDCGGQKIVQSGKLLNGDVKSCGCWHVVHGHTRGHKYSSEYNTWISMKGRCGNEKNKCYKRYGGRGITVCERWLESFENFISDMGMKPSKSYSIDRIDNNKGYYPENCKWSNPKEQARNTRNNVMLLNTETGIYYSSVNEAAESYHERKNVFCGLIARDKLAQFKKI